MNIMDRWAIEDRIRGNLAAWMEKHGEVLDDRTNSNPYCTIRIREIAWQGRTFEIIEVDGITTSLI